MIPPNHLPPRAIATIATSRRRTAVPDAQRLVQKILENEEEEEQSGGNSDNHDHNRNNHDDQKQAQFLELQSLSAGQVADLVHLQRERHLQQQPPPPVSQVPAAGAAAVASFQYSLYEPLDPFLFHPQQERTPIEPGRLDSRILSLRQALSKLLDPEQLKAPNEPPIHGVVPH